VRMLKRMLPRSKPGARADFKPLPGFLNSAVKAIFFCEAQLLRFCNFPFGLSVMAVGVKR